MCLLLIQITTPTAKTSTGITTANARLIEFLTESFTSIPKPESAWNYCYALCLSGELVDKTQKKSPLLNLGSDMSVLWSIISEPTAITFV